MRIRNTTLMRAALFCTWCGIAPATAAQNGIPNFTSTEYGWVMNGALGFRAIPGVQPPVGVDPRYPQSARGTQAGDMERMGDAENSNLQDWAKEIMRKFNQDVLQGHRAFIAQSRCWPGGTPGQLLFVGEPLYFIQTPNEVWILWQREQQVRRIYLNVPHSRNPKPSWFGESVGHYENDELVVDTIGFLNKHPFDFLDNWRTPHTDQLHVVERFKTINNGNGLQATVTVEDPGTFYKPWSGMYQWRKVNEPMLESVCAENNSAFEQFFGLKEYPMPEAKTSDF
jgi:hypothetical protein